MHRSVGSTKSADAARVYPAGLAVITVMLMTTSLVSLVMIICWEVHLLLVAVFWLLFTFIEAAFWTSNIVKVCYSPGRPPLRPSALKPWYAASEQSS